MVNPAAFSNITLPPPPPPQTSWLNNLFNKVSNAVDKANQVAPGVVSLTQQVRALTQGGSVSVPGGQPQGGGVSIQNMPVQRQGMSTTEKVLIGTAVAAVVGGSIYYFTKKKKRK